MIAYSMRMHKLMVQYGMEWYETVNLCMRVLYTCTLHITITYMWLIRPILRIMWFNHLSHNKNKPEK